MVCETSVAENLVQVIVIPEVVVVAAVASNRGASTMVEKPDMC